MTDHADWPALPYGEWAPTKKTLHLVVQMLGKAKLALAPPQPEWLHVPLFLGARGFATGPMPYPFLGQTFPLQPSNVPKRFFSSTLEQAGQTFRF